jgi:hypothetical protein
MAVQSYVMGPGLFSLGAGPLAVEAQVASLTVTDTEKVKTTDPEPMLSGDELTTPDVVTMEWKLAGKIVQDLAAAGVVTYTWTNTGDEVAFSFTPNTVTDRKVTGIVRLVPLAIGGDPKTRPKSDFTWVIIGTPTLEDA